MGWGTRLSQLSLVIPIFDQDLSMSQIVGGTGVVIPRGDQRFQLLGGDLLVKGGDYQNRFRQKTLAEH